ncbi:hypothetical protein [Lactobacillus crispatus]|uniref:hypothetical protein n=1 Tax=Lactobacillus crispatus TaxID=47770 RepID=UPI001F093B18|nr:hypothetical protein [Lactobacillus crispatus]MCT7688212.1 hypothetical protein [Lactobacillus crispatus]MCT7889255.1 hypothetical protein [Lactobacillus crispatus]
MKFTSRDLINKFLENMDTQKGKSLDIAVSNIFYDKDVLDDENIIFADDSEAYNALEELAQVQKGNDGIFSVINVARKVMKANAEDEKAEILKTMENSEYRDLKLAKVDEDLEVEMHDLNSSWSLAHKYAEWIALNRICYYTVKNQNTYLDDENFKEIHDKLESLLANQDDPRLDRALGYRLVSIEK